MESLTVIRKWAWKNGIAVFPRGRVAADIIDAYRQWRESATAKDLEDLGEWDGPQVLPKAPKQLRRRTPDSSQTSSLEAIVRDIGLFEKQNPLLQVTFAVKRRGDD